MRRLRSTLPSRPASEIKSGKGESDLEHWFGGKEDDEVRSLVNQALGDDGKK